MICWVMLPFLKGSRLKKPAGGVVAEIGGDLLIGEVLALMLVVPGAAAADSCSRHCGDGSGDEERACDGGAGDAARDVGSG